MLHEGLFLVGVTGHRDLLPDQLPAIRVAVRSLFEQLITALPGVRIQLLCSMADGADLLAARVALDLGLTVLALLTFPEDICRADLLSEEARESFDLVMARAERLTLPLPQGVTRESLANGSPARERQYRRAALLLARSCSLLLAIWDGKPTTHVAGSARVVDFRRRRLLFDIRCGRATAPGGDTPAEVTVRGFSGTEVASPPGRCSFELPAGLQRLLQRDHPVQGRK